MSWDIKMASESCKHRANLYYEEKPKSYVKIEGFWVCLLKPSGTPPKERLCLEAYCPLWTETTVEPPP